MTTGTIEKKNCTDERKRKGKRAHIRKKEKKRNLPILGFYSLSFFFVVVLVVLCVLSADCVSFMAENKTKKGSKQKRKKKVYQIKKKDPAIQSVRHIQKGEETVDIFEYVCQYECPFGSKKKKRKPSKKKLEQKSKK